jgi:hypothetical protein
MALTGKIDFRKGWFGSLVLQVEEDVKPLFGRKVKRRWRRATAMDLAHPELRVLIDMRSRPHLGASTSLPSLVASSRASSALAASENGPGRKEPPASRLPH